MTNQDADQSRKALLLTEANDLVDARDEPGVQPNHVYVIPPDRSMIIIRGTSQLLPRELGLHRSADQFFCELAEPGRHREGSCGHLPEGHCPGRLAGTSAAMHNSVLLGF